jgi:hypothetical protein
MQRLFLLLLVAALLPAIAIAQSQTVTAKWTAEQRIVLSELPSQGQPVEMATPASRLDKPDELRTVCAQMNTEIATWAPSDDGKKILITLNRALYPDWDKETWQLHLTRAAGVYLVK